MDHVEKIEDLEAEIAAQVTENRRLSDALIEAQRLIATIYAIVRRPQTEHSNAQLANEYAEIYKLVFAYVEGEDAAPQPAAAPAVDAAPVGEREPSYNAFKHQYDDEVPDRGHTAYTLESAADWCLQAIEQTDMRDNYKIEHEQAIQALTYGLQDVIGYLKTKGETR